MDIKILYWNNYSNQQIKCLYTNGNNVGIMFVDSINFINFIKKSEAKLVQRSLDDIMNNFISAGYQKIN